MNSKNYFIFSKLNKFEIKIDFIFHNVFHNLHPFMQNNTV